MTVLQVCCFHQHIVYRRKNYMYSATRLERTIHLNWYSKIRYILEKQCPTSVHLSNTRHPINQLPLYNPNLAAMHTPRRHRVPRTRRRDPVSTGPELRGIRQSPRRQRTRTAAHSGKSSPGQCTHWLTGQSRPAWNVICLATLMSSPERAATWTFPSLTSYF